MILIVSVAPPRLDRMQDPGAVGRTIGIVCWALALPFPLLVRFWGGFRV